MLADLDINESAHMLWNMSLKLMTQRCRTRQRLRDNLKGGIYRSSSRVEAKMGINKAMARVVECGKHSSLSDSVNFYVKDITGIAPFVCGPIFNFLLSSKDLINDPFS